MIIPEVQRIFYVMIKLRIETEVGRALTDAGREMAQNASLMESSLLAGTEGKARVKEYLDGRSGVEMLQNGADGISLAGSTWSFEDRILTLRASYQVLLPPGISWFHPVRITQTKVLRGWTGFGKRQAFSGEQGEEVVYVTDYGTVYHRRLNCRHLKLLQVCAMRAGENTLPVSGAGGTEVRLFMLQRTETDIMKP